MLASDLANPEFVGAVNGDQLLSVKFYKKAVEIPFRSQQEGKPVFEERVYVRIQKPGDSLSIIDTPAWREHELRFPVQWRMFKDSQGDGEQIVGTPLAEWPAVSRSQAEELRAQKFFTVEQIAGASDLQTQSMGMIGPSLRQRAQAYLQAAKDSALPQKQALELAKKDEEIAELKRITAETNARLEAFMASQERKKPGRKPKETVEA